MKLTLKALFQNPPAQFRPMPFWGWNDRLEPKEMQEQITSMKAHGIGGFFMHSREGLETEYMGDEWMTCIRASVEKAKEQGVYAWMYDEDRWPSGTAGGQVTAGNEDYRAKGLTIEMSQAHFTPQHNVLALFKAQVEDMKLLSCERLDISEPHPALQQYVYLIYRIETAEPSEWFNNQSPPDNLNPDTIGSFIEKTHEVYKKAVGEEFGKTIPGIFTDEPGLHDRHCHFVGYRGWIPWTIGFADFFTKMHGYDVLETVPYIFFDGDLSSKARHDFWWTITELFSNAYTRQLYDWCEKNELASTGHFLWEGNLGVATRVCGAMMPNYRYQHIPGVDLLNLQTDEYMTMKQCTSVANQYDRERVITETYGCTGWDFDFEGQKWIGDFQLVMGVNMLCKHLALYSIRGCRKRDYPPFFGANTTWWKYNQVTDDYFGRLSAVLSKGKPIRDVLVLHPSTTAWAMLGSNPYGLKKRGNDRDIPAIKEYGDDFNLFLKYLMSCHHDFDLGDELILRENGTVSADKLQIRKTQYKVVIIPSVKTLMDSTCVLLAKFMDQGGKVLSVEPIPTMVSGVSSKELQTLFQHKNMITVKKWTEVKSVLNALQTGMVRLTDRFDVEIPSLHYMLRETDDFYSLFIVNNDTQSAYPTKITFTKVGAVEEWLPLTGNIETPDFNIEDGKLCITTHFGPTESRLFIIDKKQKPIKPYQNKEKKLRLDGVSGTTYAYTRTLPNALTLDKCRYWMDGIWSDEMDVWQAQQKIREKLEMLPIYYNDERPQRYTWIYEPHPKDNTQVSFEFVFDVKDMPNEPLELVVEKPEWFEIKLNGTVQDNKPIGYFLDKAFGRILLDGVIPGKNTLTLCCAYRNSMEVEDCYLMGSFGLDRKRRITLEPEKLSLGDWSLQGFMHYPGSIVYHFDYAYTKDHDGEQIVLKLGTFSAVVVEVRINGETAGYIPWKAASSLDITRLFHQDGVYHIELEVMGSPRNLFGPFHQSEKTRSVNSGSFRTTGKNYTPEYFVKAYGLFDAARIYKTVE